MSPRTMNYVATFADGSTNCGMKARKNAAVFGFSASTTTPPSRKARLTPVVCTSVGLPEPDKIEGPRILQQGERLSACHDERRYADSAGENVHKAAET